MTRSFISIIAPMVGLMSLVACTKLNPDLIADDASSSSFVDDDSTDTGEGESSGEGGMSGDGEDGSEADGSGSGTDLLSDLPDEEVCSATPSALPPECSECLELSCCAELLACLDDTGCACMSACLLEGNEQLPCALECALSDPLELPASVSAIQACQSSSCEASCGDVP
jgi:hypothetical protein